MKNQGAYWPLFRSWALKEFYDNLTTEKFLTLLKLTGPIMDQSKKKALVKNTLVVVALIGVSAAAMAGTGSTGTGNSGDFISPLYDFMKGSMEGWVGKAIAIGGLAYGLVAGIARGSIAGLGAGVGLGIGAIYGPKVIEGLATAVL